MVVFVMLLFCGLIQLAIGLYDFRAKKPQSFWTGGIAPNVNDIKKWNYALGKLFSVYGISIILTAFAFLFPLNDTLPTVLVLVFPVGGIAIMILLYIKIIEPKYKEKQLVCEV